MTRFDKEGKKDKDCTKRLVLKYLKISFRFQAFPQKLNFYVWYLFMFETLNFSNISVFSTIVFCLYYDQKGFAFSEFRQIFNPIFEQI